MNDLNETIEQPALLIKQDSITVITDDGPRIVRRGQVNFSSLQEAIHDKDWGLVETLANPIQNIQEAVARLGGGRVELLNNQVLCDGQPLNGYLVTKIIGFANGGLPFDHLLEFLNNLQNNPSMRAREELYKFLETEDLPVTSDGHFLAYKAVRSDWKDKHSGRISNNVGNVVEMPRVKVDDNQAKGCSAGLHAGSLSYVRWFGHESSQDIFLIVKIDPKDVVCIPQEDCRKLRCCRYEVVGTMTGEMVHHAYEADGVTPLGARKVYNVEPVEPEYEDWDDDPDEDFDYAMDDYNE